MEKNEAQNKRISNEPELMTPEEVAEYLRIKRNSVYRMIANKELPCIRIGDRRALRVRRADLTAYLERCIIQFE